MRSIMSLWVAVHRPLTAGVVAVVAIAIFATVPRPSAAQTSSFQYFSISRVERDGVTARRYRAQSEGDARLPIPESVRVWDGASSMLDALPNRTINSQDELALFLIENGLAEVVDPEATPGLARAEAIAKANRMGLWASRIPPARSPTPVTSAGKGEQAKPSSQSVIDKFVAWVRASWRLLAPAGLVSLIAAVVGRWAFRKFYVQRRVKLSVIGLPAAGKSAVLRRFRDPTVTEADILDSRPTMATETSTTPSPIVIGKYEVHADLEDNPGENWGAFFRAVTTRGLFGTSVALLVLAPTDDRDATRENWRNQSFIDEQIGMAKALVGGCLQTTGRHRPTLIIIYLNKFDLISDQGPGDSTARDAKNEFLAAFESFLNLQVITAQQASKKPPLVKVIVGSALKNWGGAQITSALQDALYAGGGA